MRKTVKRNIMNGKTYGRHAANNKFQLNTVHRVDFKVDGSSSQRWAEFKFVSFIAFVQYI